MRRDSNLRPIAVEREPHQAVSSVRPGLALLASAATATEYTAGSPKAVPHSFSANIAAAVGRIREPVAHSHSHPEHSALPASTALPLDRLTPPTPREPDESPATSIHQHWGLSIPAKPTLHPGQSV